MLTVEPRALQLKISKKKNPSIGLSFAVALCIGVAGAAAFSFFEVPPPLDWLISSGVAVGGFGIWFIGALFSKAAALSKEKLEHPLERVAQPRYLGMILMIASPLALSYTTYNVQEKLAPVLECRARLTAPTPASFPPLKLKAIMFNGSRSSAIINGESFRIGDEVQGVLITEINPYSVTVEFHGEKKVIKLSKQAGHES